MRARDLAPINIIRPRLCRTRCHLCGWVTYGAGTTGIPRWIAHLDTHLGPNRRTP